MVLSKSLGVECFATWNKKIPFVFKHIDLVRLFVLYSFQTFVTIRVVSCLGWIVVLKVEE